MTAFRYVYLQFQSKVKRKAIYLLAFLEEVLCQLIDGLSPFIYFTMLQPHGHSSEVVLCRSAHIKSSNVRAVSVNSRTLSLSFCILTIGIFVSLLIYVLAENSQLIKGSLNSLLLSAISSKPVRGHLNKVFQLVQKLVEQLSMTSYQSLNIRTNPLQCDVASTYEGLTIWSLVEQEKS